MCASNFDRLIVRLGGWVLALLLAAGPASGYDLLTDQSGIYAVAWSVPVVTMQLKLPAPSAPLIDGTNYNTSVQAAMKAWNDVLGTVQLSGQISGSSSYSNGNGVNEIVMDSTMDGSDFGKNVLAVTVGFVDARGARKEADIMINTAYTWDSFRGGPQSGKQDIRRVVIHELGHVLGLDHPDQASPPQIITAIMNSHISYSPAIDALQPDDITGAQSLYGSPGFIPANDNFANAIAVVQTGSLTTLTGSNVAATKESGEPAPAGGTGTNSVWWKWTAPSGGNTTITTLGSRFDTAIGVYTGSAVTALTKVADNDDVTSGVIRTSSVTFNAVSGTTYYIDVLGWDNYFGSITLNLSFDGVVVVAPPVITSQPESQTTTPGGGASFAVTASGSPTYQWKLNGTPISGATSATLTLTNVVTANAGTYTVTATNIGGSATSNPATLTVLANPVANEIATTGHDVSFSATGAANGSQWQVSTDNGVTWSSISNNTTYSGVGTGTLGISGVTASLSGNQYRLISSTNGGTSTSNVATLTVNQVFVPFPVCLDFDSSGNFYVGDVSSNTVQKVTSSGAVTLVAGTSGSNGSTDGAGAAARFNQPDGLAASGDGTLEVADMANATIRRISAAGLVTTSAGAAGSTGSTDGSGAAARFNGPAGVALDGSGNYFVADAMNHVIRKLTSLGAVTTYAGTPGVSGTADGAALSAARFNHPTGVAADGSGNVYVADTTNNTIRKITPAGAVSTLAGLAGVSGSSDGAGSAALFSRPGGLALDSLLNLYVADTGNSTIRKITPAGVVTTVAGLPGVAGLKDGVGNDAWFNQPQDVAVDGSGTVYVADTGNATIRRVTAAGAVNTLALTQGATSTPTTTPTPTPTPTPSTGGGGGGGGATGGAFVAALALFGFIRWSRGKW